MNNFINADEAAPSVSSTALMSDTSLEIRRRNGSVSP